MTVVGSGDDSDLLYFCACLLSDEIHDQLLVCLISIAEMGHKHLVHVLAYLSEELFVWFVLCPAYNSDGLLCLVLKLLGIFLSLLL